MQKTPLCTALKQALRLRKLTYADVAAQLQVSESSVKRLLNRGGLSLERLQQICEWAGIELSELSDWIEQQRRTTTVLTEQQEQQLLTDIRLLLVAFLLLNHWTYDQIIAEYDIDTHTATRILATLDRIKIIDLLPQNKVRVRLSRQFQWRRQGPIETFFQQHVQAEFLQSRFDQPGELRLFHTGMLSDRSIDVIQQRLQRLTEEFELRVQDDKHLPPEQQKATTLLAAIRPWQLSIFEALKRPSHGSLDAVVVGKSANVSRTRRERSR